jgi:MFS transporter, FHS family, glucose/mannose:H+ symporter
MPAAPRDSSRSVLALLHPVFALTGVVHAIGGPLLPSLVSTFHLDDKQSGLLFLLYFSGTSLGALLCRTNYARAMAIGFAAVAGCCFLVAAVGWPLLLLGFLFLGVGIGVPMTGVSLFVGRAFPKQCASVLTFLNFTWSVGALLAPLLAARILVHHGYRFAYVALAIASVFAALLCALLLRDPPEVTPTPAPGSSFASLRLIIAFAFAAFLQVGVENTSAAWLSTYSLRMAHVGEAFAAASSSLYWAGFLASRGLASLLLIYTRPRLLLHISVALALLSGAALAVVPSAALRNAGMFFLGIGLAPIFPLLLSEFFSVARHTSQSRWVLAAAGFGGSVLPWFAGCASAAAGSIRAGILVIPAAMLLMILILPAATGRSRAQ